MIENTWCTSHLCQSNRKETVSQWDAGFVKKYTLIISIFYCILTANNCSLRQVKTIKHQYGTSRTLVTNEITEKEMNPQI